KTLIRVTGACPGLVLESLQLSDFLTEAVEFLHAPAAATKPVRLEHVRFLTLRNYADESRDRAADVRPAALTISADASGAGDGPSLAVTNCRFEGLYRSAVRIEGSVRARFERNRFFTLREDERPAAAHDCDVFLVRDGAPRLTLKSNTVARFANFLRFEHSP